MSQLVQLVRAVKKKADKTTLSHWYASPQDIELPDIASSRVITQSQFQAILRRFNTVHQWGHNHVHPCFAQFLGLGQHIQTLAHTRSPFPLMGLVHTDNVITTHTPLTPDETTIACHFHDIRQHARGITVDIDISARQAGRLCVHARSTYLYRTGLSDSTLAINGQSTETQPGVLLSRIAELTFKQNAGRQYARISGDYNPIHLSDWSARLLGFKKMMAHGTHVLARTLTALEDAHHLFCAPTVVKNQFMYPASLPSSTTLNCSAPAENADPLFFELCNLNASRRKQCVLTGNISLRPPNVN